MEGAVLRELLAAAQSVPTPALSATLAPPGHGAGAGVSLSELANAFTIGGFVVASAAIWFAGRQLRMQARSQRLTAILETNRLWWDVPTVHATIQTPAVVSGVTLDLVAHVYREIVADRDAAVGPWPEPRADARQGVPFILAALFPVAEPGAPTTEAAYRRRMLDRALGVGIVLTVLNLIARGADVSALLSSGRFGPDAAAKVRADLQVVQDALDRYVGALNEIAELYGARLIDRRLFLGKRHVALIQQAFVVEPYLLWRNTVHGGRWGLRVLALGE
ncbi:MAG: hypothetical protein ACYDB7_09695, partial [Mycobacteriales bacterium]